MKKVKEQYAAPALRLIPLQLETGLCASTVDTGNLDMGYNNPFSDSEEQLY